MVVTTPEKLPVAFLFVVPRRGENEGESLDEAFLHALKNSDPDGAVWPFRPVTGSLAEKRTPCSSSRTFIKCRSEIYYT
jgi:hypothetical protein